MEQFYTRDKANEGIELPLYLPTGIKSKDSLTVLGVDSDTYNRVNIDEQRKFSKRVEAAALIEDDTERKVFMDEKEDESKVVILSALIKDWTFDQECTEENKVQFLKNAPQIAEAINKFAADRKRFFGKG